MKITLEQVKTLLREIFGFESFIATFLSEIKEDKNIPTAAITKQGILYYNPEFTQKYITSREDLFSLIFHEILHPVFSHFIHGRGELENIACDAVINAVISKIYNKYSKEGALFKKYYKPLGIEGILRPQSDLKQTKFNRLYNHLYEAYANGNKKLSTGEIINTLKILSPQGEAIKIILIGSHLQGTERFSHDIIGRISADIKRTMPQQNMYSGNSAHLQDVFIDTLKTHLSIKNILLSKYTTKRRLDHFREVFKENRRTVSPIPIYPSKRDLTLLAAGIYPSYFHNNIQKIRHGETGIACYLDVSGSVLTELPNIVAILRKLGRDLKSIFLFSNKVVEVSFSALIKGKFETTYGTDFDCIAESILEREYKKAVIITDGYASMRTDLAGRIREQGTRILTILFGDAKTCRDLIQFGEVLTLDDVTS